MHGDYMIILIHSPVVGAEMCKVILKTGGL